MKLIVSFIAVAAWVLLLVGCSAAEVDPRKLVPPDATLVGEVRVADILKDPDLAKLYDSAPKGKNNPQTFEELLASGTRETGVDIRTIRTAVVFGDATSDDEYLGAILQGKFDEAGLVSVVGKVTPDLTDTRYKDRQVYVSRSKDSTRAFTVLGKDLLVVGSLPAVQSVIDVHAGDQVPAYGRVYGTFQSLGTPLFRLAMEMPRNALPDSEDSLKDIPGLGSIPLGAEALDSLEVIGVAMDKQGQNVTVQARLAFRDAGSADRVEGLVSGGISLMRGFTTDRQVRDVLDQVQVKVSDARLDLVLRASVADLQALAAKSGSLPLPY